MTFEQIAKENIWLQPIIRNMPRRFYSRIEVCTYTDGKLLVQKGIENPYIFFLIYGQVKIQNEYFNGKVFSYAVKPAPGLVGLLEFFAEELVSTSTVRSIGETLLLRIKKPDFSSWVSNDFNAYQLCTKYFAKQMYPSIAKTGIMNAYSKKRTFVNYLVQQYEMDVKRQGEHRILQTREDLANSMGMSQRTIYRLVDELVNDGFLTISKGKLFIGRDQLRRMREYQESDED